MLNNIREGNVSDSTAATIRALQRPLERKTGMDPVELFCCNEEVDRANAARLETLTSDLHEFKAIENRNKGLSSDEENMITEAFLNMSAPECLGLKVGCPVMLTSTVNVNLGLVTSLKGTVCEFRAISQECKGVAIDVREIQPVLQGTLYPVVRFQTKSGTIKVALRRETYRVKDARNKVIAKFVQIPLTLAWALSVHKAQGQEYNCIIVDLKRVFVPGEFSVLLTGSWCNVPGLYPIRTGLRCNLASKIHGRHSDCWTPAGEGVVYLSKSKRDPPCLM